MFLCLVRSANSNSKWQRLPVSRATDVYHIITMPSNQDLHFAGFASLEYAQVLTKPGVISTELIFVMPATGAARTNARCLDDKAVLVGVFEAQRCIDGPSV